MNAIVPTSNVDSYRQSTDAAGMCREIVLKTAQTIQGRKYVKVEGWQAIAIAHGCAASADHVERVNDEGMSGFRAIGIVRRMSDGAEIARAEGFLGDDEQMWTKRPVYARRAMVQTRAISRACRSAFAHVVVLIDANLSTTPAEEVPIEGFGEDAPRFMQNGAPDEKPPSKAALKRSGIYETLRDEMDACQDIDELEAWNIRRTREIKGLPKDWYDALADRFMACREELLNGDDPPAESEELDEAFRQTMAEGSSSRMAGRGDRLEAAE